MALTLHQKAFKYIVIIILVITIIIYLNEQSNAKDFRCCQQCLSASSQEVRGQGISNELCNSQYYLEKNIYTQECIEYFQKNTKQVIDCEK